MGRKLFNKGRNIKMGKIEASVLVEEESDLLYTSLTMPFDLEIKALKCWIVFFNNPTFSSLVAQVRYVNDGVLSFVQSESEPVLKSEIDNITEIDMWKNLPFIFTKPIVWHKENILGLTLKINDYTYSDNSHIAWAFEREQVYGAGRQLSVQVVGVQL
jgi:hypothetical protein